MLKSAVCVYKRYEAAFSTGKCPRKAKSQPTPLVYVYLAFALHAVFLVELLSCSPATSMYPHLSSTMEDSSVKWAGWWWAIATQTEWQVGNDPAPPLVKHLVYAQLCQLGKATQTKTSPANWRDVRGNEDGHVWQCVSKLRVLEPVWAAFVSMRLHVCLLGFNWILPLGSW